MLTSSDTNQRQMSAVSNCSLKCNVINIFHGILCKLTVCSLYVDVRSLTLFSFN